MLKHSQVWRHVGMGGGRFAFSQVGLQGERSRSPYASKWLCLGKHDVGIESSTDEPSHAA